MIDYAEIYNSLENINKVPESIKEAYKISMVYQILIYIIIFSTNEKIQSNAKKFLPADVTIDKFKSDVDKLKNFCQNYYSTSDNTFCRVYLANGIDDTINKVMNRMYNTDNGKSTADIDNAIKFIKNN